MKGSFRSYLGEVVRSIVEETLNATLDADERSGMFPEGRSAVDAGGGQTAPCSRHEVAHAAIYGHVNGRAKTFGSPSGEPKSLAAEERTEEGPERGGR